MNAGTRWAETRQVVARGLPHAGLDLPKLGRCAAALPGFVRDYRRYRMLAASTGQRAPRWGELFPVLDERHEPGGQARGHYVHQDLWAARRIFDNRPAHHLDIGSRLDGFITSLLVFQSVTVVDVRPLDAHLPNLSFVQGDATDLRFVADRSTASVSSLHAMEHFGLGRYGDPLDPAGWSRGIAELVRICAPGGRVYFSAPVGRERVMFNAHRVFAPETVLAAFAPLELAGFALVDDAGDLIEGASPGDAADAEYACGLFEWVRA